MNIKDEPEIRKCIICKNITNTLTGVCYIITGVMYISFTLPGGQILLWIILNIVLSLIFDLIINKRFKGIKGYEI